MTNNSPLPKAHSKALKKLSLASRKLFDEYKTKHFEYLSYKDFCRLMKGLEELNAKIEELANDQNG